MIKREETRTLLHTMLDWKGAGKKRSSPRSRKTLEAAGFRPCRRFMLARDTGMKKTKYLR
jgi:hypothetical protein